MIMGSLRPFPSANTMLKRSVEIGLAMVTWLRTEVRLMSEIDFPICAGCYAIHNLGSRPVVNTRIQKKKESTLFFICSR